MTPAQAAAYRLFLATLDADQRSALLDCVGSRAEDNECNEPGEEETDERADSEIAAAHFIAAARDIIVLDIAHA